MERSGCFTQYSFFIKERNVLVKVKIKDILYIKAEHKYCILHTTQRKYTTRTALKNLLEKLPANYVRVHRSYVIDLLRIDQIILEDFMIYIESNPVPIGMSYKDELLSRLEKL